MKLNKLNLKNILIFFNIHNILIMFKKFQYKIFTLVSRMSEAQWSVELLLKQTARVRIEVKTVFLNHNLYLIIMFLI